jgi:hypothetical protein
MDMANAVSSVATGGIPPLTILSFPRLSNGKVTLPVRPAYTLLASFKHIHVIPDSRQVNGIPLYKLNALDSLLDRLANARPDAGTLKVDAGSIDALVVKLSSEVLSRAASPFSTGMLPDIGGVVDLVA